MLGRTLGNRYHSGIAAPSVRRLERNDRIAAEFAAAQEAKPGMLEIAAVDEEAQCDHRVRRRVE